MNLEALLDPTFGFPLVTGLVFALTLPVLGLYLRLRDEWLAALAFAQFSAAGSLAAAVVSLPFQAGALAAACAGALAKGALARSGNSGYALILLAGWAVSILLLVNVPAAEHLAHALFDGQLYFAGPLHLAGALAFLLVSVVAMRWLSRPLLLERMLPDFFSASGRSARRYHLLFDLLIACGLALSTASMGVMASFCLVFIPALIAYWLGPNWRGSLLLAGAVGLGAYLLAFALALTLDQPFGPVLVLVLLAATGAAHLAVRMRGRARATADGGNGRILR